MQLPEIVKLGDNEQLSISNDGHLSMFWIGVGSAFSKKLYQTNVVIIKGNDHILIDCGTRCSCAFHKYGLPITSIENLFITHTHADHIGGMEEVALMGRYFTKKKPNLYITKKLQKILWESSLRGGCAHNEIHDGKELEFTDFFTPHYLKSQSKPGSRIKYHFKVGDIDIKVFRVKHIPDNSADWETSFPAYGIVVDNKVLFTSDTRFDSDLIHSIQNEFKDLTAIFHDCQLFNGGVHTSYEELLQYPDEIRQMMFLTHYNDNFEQFKPENDRFAGFAQQGCYYNFK